METWTKKDFKLAKKYPNLAKRAIKNSQTPINQILIEQKKSIIDYENTYVVNNIDILTKQ